MKIFTRLALLGLALIAATPTAHAIPFVGSTAALKARESLIANFVAGKTNEVAVGVLERIVELNLNALEVEGYRDLAERYRRLWGRALSIAKSPRRGAIGDHDPLSPVLVEIYTELSRVLGKNSKYGAILKDLNTMNFAIPVVFNPRGDWRRRVDSRADREEYGEHFTPFAGVVTYYASLTACRQAANANGLGKLGKVLCPRVAERLEAEMSTRLAPKLGDYVFDRANGIHSVLKLTNRDFLYSTERDLQLTRR